MKTKRPQGRLHLSRETVRQLTDQDLAGAAGGVVIPPYNLSKLYSCVRTWCAQDTCYCNTI